MSNPVIAVADVVSVASLCIGAYQIQWREFIAVTLITRMEQLLTVFQEIRQMNRYIVMLNKCEDCLLLGGRCTEVAVITMSAKPSSTKWLLTCEVNGDYHPAYGERQ